VINKDTIQSIGDKEMDRKDFLKYSGLVLLSVIGLKTITNILIQPDAKKTLTVNTGNKNPRGFGDGKYGA
jgi:hypothetical protein